MEPIVKLKIQAIKCKKCEDIIFSRADHDFHHCSCRNIFVDGGFSYLRCGAKDLNDIENIKIELDVTKKELYDDWNKGINKFGVIVTKIDNGE